MPSGGLQSARKPTSPRELQTHRKEESNPLEFVSFWLLYRAGAEGKSFWRPQQQAPNSPANERLTAQPMSSRDRFPPMDVWLGTVPNSPSLHPPPSLLFISSVLAYGFAIASLEGTAILDLGLSRQDRHVLGVRTKQERERI